MVASKTLGRRNRVEVQGQRGLDVQVNAHALMMFHKEVVDRVILLDPKTLSKPHQAITLGSRTGPINLQAVHLIRLEIKPT